MTYRHLRLKINLIVSLTAGFFVAFMWFYNTEMVARNWPQSVADLPIFTTVVGAIIVIALVIIYYLLAPLVRCLKRIEEGAACTGEERIAALKAMVRLPIVILAVNVLGFFVGPVGNMLPKALLRGEEFFTALNMLTIFYNTLIGLVCSLTIIMQCNIALDGVKRLFNIRSLAELEGVHIKDLSMRVKNILYPFGMALMFGALIGVAGYSFYNAEITETTALYAHLVERNGLTDGENEHAHNLRLLLTPDAGRIEKQAAAAALIGVMENRGNQFLLSSGALFLILFLVTLALSIFFSSETSAYLKKFRYNLLDVLEGEGDLSTRLHVAQFNELGDLAVLFNRFIETLYALLSKVKIASEKTASSSGILNRLIDNFSKSSSAIAGGSEEVRRNILTQVEAVTAANEAVVGILSSVEEVRESVATQAGFIEQSSASISQMSANISSVAKTTGEAHRLSDTLVALARDGEEKVTSTVAAMEAINRASQLVGEIVEAISRITSQTNLLSMNASIEAAHAGTFGKGFAVVADEVKKLAEESATSANQIKSEINEMTRSIENGVLLSQKTGEALTNMAADINAHTKLIMTIAEAMNEQNSGTREIMDSVGNIVNTTNTIKERTKDQYLQSNAIRERMDVLVTSTANIRGAVDRQTEDMKSLFELIDNLKRVIAGNQETVREMEQAIGKFKLS